ncbi:hypothetical protein AAHA92_06795 [Salvia divinorum]|uniref:Uncharacterized protein n=1 Tax=Salvia divinorum TaxID=28513 RepID=A0ABD1I7X4_SALDI
MGQVQEKWKSGDLKKATGKQENLPGITSFCCSMLGQLAASPKETSASGEPSQSSGLANVDNTVDVNKDKAPHHDNASNEANEPSASVHPEE